MVCFNYKKYLIDDFLFKARNSGDYEYKSISIENITKY